jgi:hypothetical protein
LAAAVLVHLIQQLTPLMAVILFCLPHLLVLQLETLLPLVVVAVVEMVALLVHQAVLVEVALLTIDMVVLALLVRETQEVMAHPKGLAQLAEVAGAQVRLG